MQNDKRYLSVQSGGSIPFGRVKLSIPYSLCKERQSSKTQDKEIKKKTWILYLIRAVGEDLAKQIARCSNSFCNKLRPRSSDWKKRSILGRKKWLCETCNAAYEADQYCEFCAQVYLERTLELATLDGKEWTQCEDYEKCSRWAHVECLARAYKRTRNEVVAKDFKYLCRRCRRRSGAKKRRKVYNDELRTNDTNNSRKIKRRCLNEFEA